MDIHNGVGGQLVRKLVEVEYKNARGVARIPGLAMEEMIVEILGKITRVEVAIPKSVLQVYINPLLDFLSLSSLGYDRGTL